MTIKGIDISQYQGTVDWNKVATDNIFAGIRVGYGRVTDKLFMQNWQSAKSKVDRLPYWYLDYYSHRMGWTDIKYTDTEWGKLQAQIAWGLLKGDRGELPLFLDVEPCTITGVPGINFITAPWVMTIIRSFLTEYDILSGGKAGIYTSPGYLSLYGDWFKDRIIWLAWYTIKTPEEIATKLSQYKWRAKAVIHQYTSTAKIDGVNGYCDVNNYLGTMQEYSAWAGDVVIEPEIPTPEDEPPVYGSTMTVICASGINVRDVPIGATGTQVIGWKPKGAIVNIIETQTIGNNLWARVDNFAWCAIRYNGIILLA